MTVRVLGFHFDSLTVTDAVDRALALMQRRESAYVCTPNPEIVWLSRKNEALRAALTEADLTLADGIGVVWASRVLGTPLPERVTGYDFLLALLTRFHGRLFLLGGKPGVAEDAAAAIGRMFPDMTVCGCLHGYLDDDDVAVETIRQAEPDLLLVCTGSPRQEIWMRTHRDQLRVGLMAGLGGCLDVLSGRTRRAPERWIKANLEWLYRLIQQPNRIVRQIRLPLFVFAVLAEKRDKDKGAS